jgi:type VI secretion system secreted protein VgrG
MTHDPSLQQAFPRLRDNLIEVIADANPGYNCISWSLGVTDHWVNPETGPSYAPLSRMDRMYAEQGYYREHDLNWRLEPGYEKVVVYGTLNLDATIHEVTHAAHQERDGTFTSKLGQLPVIRHATPEDLRGPSYGLPVAVYVRPIDGNAK